VVKQDGQPNPAYYYVHPDHLGSLAIITDANGVVKQKCTYDAWGKRTLVQGTVLFDRGFTGHEHLDEFSLINMNGRMYDPMLGRFLSPDPYVQAPEFSQSYNRYSYCLNNPLIFTDPDGEWIHILIGAIIGGAINLTVKAIQGKVHNFGDGLAAFGIGAVAGAVGAATGGTAFLAAGGGAAGAGGFAAGAISGMVGSAFSTPILSMGNSIYFGDPMITPGQMLTGIAAGGLIGGSVNGITALANGRTFMNGTLKPPPPSTVRPTLPSLNSSKPELNTDGMRAEIKTAVPDNQSAVYKDTYLHKVSGNDGQHVWNRHSVEIVVDNGKIFPITGGDGKGSILVQQLGKHHGVDGIFEIIVRDGMVTHQRFIPGGIITGFPQQIVPNVPRSVSPGFQWWKSIK
jgi:RHS repeat-associated protein